MTGSVQDILNDTRLQTVPARGFLTFELVSDQNTATNNFVTSVQMPSGDTPMNAVAVPGDAGGNVGVLDDRMKMQISVPVTQGGHTQFSVTRTGATAILFYRVTYSPIDSPF